ncbi:MAG: TldD/PmbA family protein, partial [Thermoprotei archaeon]
MSERKVKEKDIVLEITEKVLEEIMEAGYSESIVSINKSKTVMAKIANSQPSVVQDWDEVTVSMYLAKDKRIAVVNFETSSIEETVKLAKKMLSEISVIEESEYYAPIPKPKPAYVPFTVHRSILKAFEEPEKIIDNALSVAFTYDVDKVAGMLEITMGIRSLASSTGASLVEEYGAYEYYIRVFKGEGSGQWSSSGRIFREENIAEATRIAAEYAVESSKPESIEPGVYDVILSPMVMGNLLNVIGRMA